MDRLSESEMCSLDARCRLPTSPVSRTAVMRLRALSPVSQALCINNYAGCDLPHLVRCAVEANISADTRWGEGDTPVLCIAAQHGSERALKALLDGRANHALEDKKGMTAAHYAAFYGRTACLRLLLDAGADKNSMVNAGFTPLHLASQKGHAECCSLLLAMGSDANARSNYLGATALLHSILFKHEACFRALLPASDLSITNMQGGNAFHACICSGNLECFELLLPLISDVDVRSLAGVNADGSPQPFFNICPLHLACSFGQERMVKALLHRGASRSSRDSVQRTPLHEASLAGHLGCVRQLLAQGGHAKICGMLCAGGARLDAVLRSGRTPLMVAQELHSSNTALIDLLAGRGPAHPPGTVCDQCGRLEPEVRLSYCTGCLVSRFCGNACAVAAWPAHRSECQRIQAAREQRAQPIITIV